MNDGELATRRGWAQLTPSARETLERGMRSGELRSVLMAIAQQRAAARSPRDVMRQWREDRLVEPSSADPRLLSVLEANVWSALPPEFSGIELSPVAPLGTCSSVSGVSQNRVVSTTRLGEVVSDSTSALAIEVAVRRQHAAETEAVHLATCQRQLRAQDFGPGYRSHFRLMCLASGTRDVGSGAGHAELLTRHLLAWRDVCAATLPGLTITVELTAWHAVLAERIDDTVLPLVEPDNRFRVVLTPERTRARGYYGAGAVLMMATPRGGQAVELGDGGFTDWTARLSANAKELCFVSCLSTERALDVSLLVDA